MLSRTDYVVVLRMKQIVQKIVRFTSHCCAGCCRVFESIKPHFKSSLEYGDSSLLIIKSITNATIHAEATSLQHMTAAGGMRNSLFYADPLTCNGKDPLTARGSRPTSHFRGCIDLQCTIRPLFSPATRQDLGRYSYHAQHLHRAVMFRGGVLRLDSKRLLLHRRNSVRFMLGANTIFVRRKALAPPRSIKQPQPRKFEPGGPAYCTMLTFRVHPERNHMRCLLTTWEPR
jgi:hypothetical protein